MIIVSFAKNDLQLQASYGSSPPCNSNSHLMACHGRHVALLCSSVEM